MKCDMCGKEGRMFRAVIEDAQLIVCEQCAKFGRVVNEILPKTSSRMQKPSAPEIAHIIVEDYAQQVKNKREKLGLTQEEFAHRINERTSIVHQLESGSLKPSASLAGKLKKAYGLNLVLEYKESNEPLKHESAEAFTLGDFIKIKKKS